MGTETLFILVYEKGTSYSSAKKCDNSKMHEELIQGAIVQKYREIVCF